MTTYTYDQIVKEGYHIRNSIIERADINIIGHFGNVVSLQLACPDVCAYSGHANTGNIGYLLKSLVELLELERDNGILFSDIRDIPVRIVIDGPSAWGGRCIGFGHFMKDKFVLTEEWSRQNSDSAT